MIRKPRFPPDKTTLLQFDSQFFETFSKESTYYGISSFYDGHRTLDNFILPIALGRTPVPENYLFLGNFGDFSDSFKIIVRKVFGAAEDDSYLFAFAMDMQRTNFLMLLKITFTFPVDYY